VILYLDFDGVLHPSEVWLIDDKPVLQWPDDPSLTLFCWAPILESILDDYDSAGRISIIISSTWSQKFGVQIASEYLPSSLKNRVIGKTTHSDRPRGVQIAQHAKYHINSQPWLAIDDVAHLWPTEHLNKLIRCDSARGLSCLKVQLKLKAKLDAMMDTL
jgi:HAD domain in Swiss Army Knife RNA repair proteins